MQLHLDQFRVTSMCRGLDAERSGFHAWQRTPLSECAREDQPLPGSTEQAWLESGTVYGDSKSKNGRRDTGLPAC